MSMLTGMPHVWQQIVLPSSQPFDTGLGLKHMVPTLPLWALTSSKSSLFILYAGYLLIVPTSSNTSTALSPCLILRLILLDCNRAEPSCAQL